MNITTHFISKVFPLFGQQRSAACQRAFGNGRCHAKDRFGLDNRFDQDSAQTVVNHQAVEFEANRREVESVAFAQRQFRSHCSIGRLQRSNQLAYVHGDRLLNN